MSPLLLATMPLCGHPFMGQPPPIVQPADVARGGPARLERDAFGVFPNSRRSEHFIIKWGDQRQIRSDQVDLIVDTLEDSWTTFVADMEHPDPVSEDWLFNVYIGDTGSGAPDSRGVGGYFWTDPQGAPMLVLSPDFLDDESFLTASASHEFYHAVQFATEHYPYEGNTAWYVEATATWASSLIAPSDDPGFAIFLGGYLLEPHRALASFAYFETGALQEYHQYGAFLFPYYLTERVADFHVVRDTWVTEIHPDPIDAMAIVLEESGIDFNETWLDHIAANATWNYRLGREFKALVEGFGLQYPGSDTVSGELLESTSERFTRMDTDLRPGRYGYNVMEIPWWIDGTLRLEIRGKDGSLDSAAHWGGRIAVVRDGEVSTTPIEFIDNQADFELEDLSDTDEAWLVLGAWTDRARPVADEETFAWSYRLTVEAPAVVGSGGSEDPGKACACGSDSPRSLGWLMLGLLALRRRR